MQRRLFPALLPALLALCGCASEKAGAPSADSPPAAVSTNASGIDPILIVTPETGLNGKVTLANVQLRFVVLTFPLDRMPQAGQHLNVYRRGLKVGEVRVNPKQLDENVVADVVAGEAEVGDVVRDR